MDELDREWADFDRAEEDRDLTDEERVELYAALWLEANNQVGELEWKLRKAKKRAKKAAAVPAVQQEPLRTDIEELRETLRQANLKTIKNQRRALIFQTYVIGILLVFAIGCLIVALQAWTGMVWG